MTKGGIQDGNWDGLRMAEGGLRVIIAQGFPMLVKQGIAKGGSPCAGARGVLAPPLLPAAAGGTREHWKALYNCLLSRLRSKGQI